MQKKGSRHLGLDLAHCTQQTDDRISAQGRICSEIGPSELHSWPRAERRATCYARPQETVADFVFGVVIPLH